MTNGKQYYMAQDLFTPWDEKDVEFDLPYKCSRCVWGHLIGGGKVVCMYHKCVKERTVNDENVVGKGSADGRVSEPDKG